MMKKCKLTVLKTTLQEDLAKEYGIPGLGTCPLMKEGQVFYADYAKPEGFAMKHGKLFTNTFLPLPTVQKAGILMIGLTRNTRAWQYAPATTVCAR